MFEQQKSKSSERLFMQVESVDDKSMPSEWKKSANNDIILESANFFEDEDEDGGEPGIPGQS